MAKKGETTERRIVAAAWKLFNEKGYDDTTVDEIIESSGTSKGSFYHYFKGKDALLGTLSILFDDKYEALAQQMDAQLDSFEQLMFLNEELFSMIEREIPAELLAYLYSSQIVTKGEKHLLDKNRLYYQLLDEIVAGGQIRGELQRDLPTGEIVHAYAMLERAFLYDWCINRGAQALTNYYPRLMRSFMDIYRTTSGEKPEKNNNTGGIE